jgi:hypothetical protein
MAARSQQEREQESGAQRKPGRGQQGDRDSAGQQSHELDYDSLREHGRALREAAGEFRNATQQALADAESMARSGVQERPYTMLGVAFAAGWVLGGGVPVRLATFATGAVGRAALGLAAARLAEFQANGSGASAKRTTRKGDGGRGDATGDESRESGAHAGM